MQDYNVLPKKTAFSSAEAKSFLTNYFTIDLIPQKCNLYQYAFFCQPEVPEDSVEQLRKIISNIHPYLKQKIGLLSIRGNILYGSKNIPVLEHKSVLKEDNEENSYQIIIKQTKTIPLIDLLHSSKENQRFIALQVINISTKEKLKKMNLTQLEKGKFYKRTQLLDNEFKNGLCALKGYKFTTYPLHSGLYLQIDIFSRIIRQKNLLQEMNSMKTMDAKIQNLQGAIVMARYGNYRTYEIISIDFKNGPRSKFKPHNSEQEITYKEYFKKLYGEDIKDLKQPLLNSISKVEKYKKAGKIQKIQTQVKLVPELLSLVGLSEQHRKDSGLMRDIIVRTQYSAQNRLRQIQTMAEELNNHEGIYVVKNPKRMKGYRLEQPKIQLNKLISAKNGQIKIIHEMIKQPIKFDNWYIIYTEKHQEEAHGLEDIFFQASKAFGIKFQEPVRFNMGKSTNPEEYKEQINLSIQERKKNPQVIVFLVGNFHKENFYREMKSFCTLHLMVPTQFLTIQKFAGQKKKHGGLMSLASNLILQMNIKVGYAIWSVPMMHLHLQKKKLMIGAISISKVNKQYFLGFVGTINDKLTKIYNETKKKKTLVEFQKNLLTQMFVNWIKVYYQSNNRAFLPDAIIFYRQGISRSELSASSKIQIEALKDMVEIAKVKTKNPNFAPEIIYYTVNKSSSSRYYEDSVPQQKFSPKFTNPASGSVIMEEMSMPGIKDFHLTPHQVNVMTTSSPTQFIQCYHEPKKISDEALIQLAFEQCFNYYNWKGAIKLPAPLQNANKLSKLASKSLKDDITPENKMSQEYHFL